MPSTLDISLFTGKLQYYFKRSFLFIVIVQSSVSVHPRHLCTSFWTTTNMASNCTLHAQVLCHDCPSYKKHSLQYGCANCSLCPVGTCMYSDESRCLQCPAGNGKKQLFHRWYTYCKRQVTGNHLKHCALKHVYITEEKTFRPYIFSTCSSKWNSVKPLSFKIKKNRILKKL